MNMTSMTKSEFVRGRPLTMRAADVVEEARQLGMKVTTGLVYSVQSQERKKLRLAKAQAEVAREEKGAAVKRRKRSKPKTSTSRSTLANPSGKGMWGALAFIKQHLQEHGHVPSPDTIASGMGTTSRLVRQALVRLRDGKYITYEHRKPETARLLPKATEALEKSTQSMNGHSQVRGLLTAGTPASNLPEGFRQLLQQKLDEAEKTAEACRILLAGN